jgi:hypothetical protein
LGFATLFHHPYGQPNRKRCGLFFIIIPKTPWVRNSEKLGKSSEKALSGQGFIIPYFKGCKHIQGTDKENKESCGKEILDKDEKRHLKFVRIRYQRSLWFRALSVRQVIEAVHSQIKVFNGVSRWRNITTLLAYLQGYAVGYSFFRKFWLFE